MGTVPTTPGPGCKLLSHTGKDAARPVCAAGGARRGKHRDRAEVAEECIIEQGSYSTVTEKVA